MSKIKSIEESNLDHRPLFPPKSTKDKQATLKGDIKEVIDAFTLKNLIESISTALMAISILNMLALPAIIIIQSFFWLKNGIWTPVPIAYLFIIKPFDSLFPNLLFEWFANPHPSWKGFHTIIIWIFNSPLSIACFLFGIVMFFVFAWFEELETIINIKKKK